ncbi:MAG: nucleoside hydrolase [Bryobacteraceae bacterium]
MKRLWLLCVLTASMWAANPVRVIFDTDIGNDVDDVLALAMLHAMESRGEAKLLAVTVTKDNPLAAPAASAVNTFYGRADIPVGAVKNGVTPEEGKYNRLLAERYPHASKFEDAVTVLRRTLEAQPDGSVVIVQVGFSTNLAHLLASPGGRELAAKKVSQLVVMAGDFERPTYREYNVKEDVASAAKVFNEWPTPIIASGFEIGRRILYPATSIERDFSWKPANPVVDAYCAYMKMPYDRETWDLTAAFYAVRPGGKYFGLSAPGTIHVGPNGETTFESSPNGKHRYLILDQTQTPRIIEAFIHLASQPVAK